MKLYDFDGMFDEKIAEYIRKNAGKMSEEELEDAIPVLYKKFGDTFIKSVGDTPNGFYAKFSDEELVKALSAHLRQGVPVSEFLCNAIESRDAVTLLLPYLEKSGDEREYAMNLIGSDERAFPAYMKMLTSKESDSDTKDRCVDFLKEKADVVLAQAVENYEKGVEREYMLEIMSRSVVRSEKVFDILLKEFKGDIENIPMHASYLAAYGDERALEILYDKIEEEGISFVEYQELKYAIEALGGEYTKARDFSDDPYYKMIKSNGNSVDIFGGINNKNDA